MVRGPIVLLRQAGVDPLKRAFRLEKVLDSEQRFHKWGQADSLPSRHAINLPHSAQKIARTCGRRRPIDTVPRDARR